MPEVRPAVASKAKRTDSPLSALLASAHAEGSGEGHRLGREPMTVRKISQEAPPERVQLTIETGGETPDSSFGDAVFLEPYPGKYEDVEMRGVFPKDGRMRFSAADMREALRLVDEMRTSRRRAAIDRVAPEVGGPDDHPRATGPAPEHPQPGKDAI